MEYENRLKDLREDSDKSQRKIAEKINIHQTTLSKYELGTIDIPTNTLKKLAKEFNTSIDYILCLTDDPRPYKRRWKNEIIIWTTILLWSRSNSSTNKKNI